MRKVLLFITFLPLAFVFSCQKKDEILFEKSNSVKYKPDYHFSPETGWMNDPNGMVYLDGEYHLFYQYYPDSTVWGPMYWGHAVSENLIDWEHLPIALSPDSLGYIFSGSAVYDDENSSGLGTKEDPPLVAIFTYHDALSEKSGSTNFQSQAIAYSIDNGRTWEKYSDNPVLSNPSIKDFRDPKVSQLSNSDGSKSWLMTLAVADHINFYSSSNLIDWSLLSEFGKNLGAHGGVWECPDLLRMKAPSGEDKWVLLVSINPGGPQMGSATQYFIGDFENGNFVPDDTMIRWLDYGPDNYAGVTWSNLPTQQDRHLFIGWMSNWLYGQQVPTSPWRSAMTIPRELSLFSIDGTLLLKSKPAAELDKLRAKTFNISDSESNLPSQSFLLTADISGDDSFSLSFLNDKGDSLVISKENGLVNIDRRKSGLLDFSKDFAAIHSAPMSWKATNLQVYVDASSIELFINDGELVMTSIVFPNTPWKKVESSSLESFIIYDLNK